VWEKGLLLGLCGGWGGLPACRAHKSIISTGVVSLSLSLSLSVSHSLTSLFYPALETLLVSWLRDMTPGAILILSQLFLNKINSIYYSVYVLIKLLIVPSYNILNI
jgi:hypothetical protein